MTSKHLMISICVFGLLAAVALWPLSCEANEYPGTGYYVFGDSQSYIVQDTGKANKNWPHLLQQWTGLHFMNLSRGGIRFIDETIAGHMRLIRANPYNTGVRGIIIALGSQDARTGSSPVKGLQAALDEALPRGFEVICLLPPDNREMTNENVREVIASMCPETIDMSLYVGPDDMVDTVHFGEAGHAKYAAALLWWFALNGRLQ